MSRLSSDPRDHQSISKQLIRVVFAFYCVIAMTVTGIHILLEYRHTREAVKSELQSNDTVFGSVIAVALWNLDYEQIDTAMDAMLEVPIVTGVKIEQQGKRVAAIGAVVENNEVVIYSQGKPEVSNFI